MDIAIQTESRTLNNSLDIVNHQEQLLNDLIAGKRSAQKILYQKYFGKMIGVTLRYTRTKEEAYEVLNDAFLKIFKSIHKYEGKGPLEGWMYKIVLFTSYQYVRDKYKIKEITKELQPQQATVDNDAWSNLGLEHIYSKIQMLPDARRIVFSMHALDGLKHKEIASELGISVSTSKWHLAQARTQLQNLLK